MKKLKYVLVILAGLTICSAPLLATGQSQEKTANEETRAAGSEKLSEEEHEAIKKKRTEQTDEEDPRGELVTNDMYMTTHPAASHGIFKVSPFLDKVYLNDGSIWQVYYDADRSVISRWISSNDQIIVSPSSFFDPTDFILVSQRTYEVVCVKLVEMEIIPSDPYYMGQRLWINQVDYIYDALCGCYFYRIVLNDGSIWEVSSRDSFLCAYFRPGDVVFVGVDESFGSPTYNILIHFNTLEYVHADCVAK